MIKIIKKLLTKQNLIIIIHNMKILNINIFIVLLFSFSQAVIAQNIFNEEWLNKDKQILNNFLLVLETGDFDLNTLKNINGIKISNEYGNLGLGYKKTIYYNNGGYTAITIKMLLDPNNNIIKYKITFSANLDVFNILDNDYHLYIVFKNYIKDINGNYITWKFEKTMDELFSRMIISFNEYFGINENIIIPNNILNDYYLLIDPFNDDIYGFNVGIAGSVPSSRLAIEKIKKVNNNYNILKLIMASPNPIGRIYAIEAISNGKINNIINDKIYSNILNKLIRLKIPIEAGSGCFVTNITIDSYEKINEAMKFIF